MAASAMAMPLLAWGGQPQKDAGLPASAAQPAAPAETLGFSELTNRMTVPVSVDGKGPYAFIIDTGAERSVVSRELADTLGLDPGARARLFDFAGASTVDTVKVPSLSAGSFSTSAIEAPSFAAANLGAQGLLGIDALQGRRLLIDFDRQRMTVLPARRHAKGDVVVRAGVRAGQLILTNAVFQGRSIDVILDTGTWVSVGNKAMQALARRKPRPLGPMTLWSVTGNSVQTDFVMVDDIRIGGVRFDKFAMSFADVAPFERFGLTGRPALILGMGALKMFRRVEIDFLNREIGFTLPRPRIDFKDVCRGGISACKRF